MAESHALAAPGAVRRWRIIATALAIAQLLTPPLISQVYGEFLSTGATNDALITPAGWAFSIWGVITLSCVATCGAVLRVGLGAAWEPRLLAGASLVFVGFIGWLIAAAHDWLWLTVGIFVVMVVALVSVMRTLTRAGGDASAPAWLLTLTTVTLGAYLGWSSVAVFANVAAALIDDGWSPAGVGWQAVILVAAAVAAVALTVYLRATPGYVAAAMWALVAIAVGALRRESPVLAGMSAAAALAVLTTAVVVTVSRRRTVPRR